MCHQNSDSTAELASSVSVSEVEFSSGEQVIKATLAEPVDGTFTESVVVFHDIWGVSDFYRDFAWRLAAEGFRVLLPDFFVREGALPELTRTASGKRREAMDQEQGLEDLGAAMRYLSGLDSGSERVAVAGFCMGGTYVLLAASRSPLPNSVVSFYGFPAGSAGWPLRPLDEMDKVRTPILFLVGDQDTSVGMENVDAYTEGVEQAGYRIETVKYAGAPHGFMTFDSENPQFEIASDAWAKMVAFFSEHAGA